MIISVLLLTLVGGAVSQWAGNQNLNPAVTKGEFYMDSNAVCNKQFELGNTPTYLYGSGAKNENNPPRTCIMTFSSENIREKRKFRIEVMEANFHKNPDDNSQAATTEFFVFDGASTSNYRLAAFGFGKSKPPNFQPLFTSGGFVTFQLQKSNPNNYNFNIKVYITSMPADVDVIDECPTKDGPGCHNYNKELVITKEMVIGIVAGLFALVIIIVVIVVVCYYCRHSGVVKRWNEFKLGQANTAATIASSDVRGNARSRDAWASQSSKYPLSATSVRTSPSIGKKAYSDTSSVFDDVPKSHPPPPPPYERYDRNRDRRNNRDNRDRHRDRYEDRDYYDSREKLDRDERYSRKSRNNRDRDRDRDRDNRRDRDRRNGNGNRGRRDRSPERSFSMSDSDETSFVQGDDDHPQDQFVEKIIEPRVNMKSRTKSKPVKAAVVDDDTDVYHELDEGEKDQGVQCKASDVEENESNTEETDAEDSSETDSEPEVDPRVALYAKPSKKAPKGAKSQPDAAVPPPQPQIQQPMPGYLPQGTLPGYGHPSGYPQPGVVVRPAMAGMPPPGVIVRPATVPHPQFNAQPQFIPSNMNQPQFIRPGMHPATLNQFGQVPQGYSQPMHNQPNISQPQYPSQGHPSQGQPRMFNAREAPLYSHRVQRGYAQSQSADSSVTGESSQSGVLNLTDDSEGHNLGSGVDFLKRTTDV